MFNHHYKIVNELLNFAIENSDEAEVKRLSTFIREMHEACLKKSTCNTPCIIQKTKRGNFCVYKDGNFHDLDVDILEQISSSSKKKKCTSLFIRMEPTKVKDTVGKIDVIIYVPSLIANNTSFKSHLVKTLSKKFSITKGSITGIMAILRGSMHDKHPNIDINIDNANDVYTILKFTVDLPKVEPVSRFLVKEDIIEKLKEWAIKFEFTVENENLERGSLIQLILCKEFDNLKATSKSMTYGAQKRSNLKF